MKMLLILTLVFLGRTALGDTHHPSPAPPPDNGFQSLFPDDVEDYWARDADGVELDVPYVPTPMNVVKAILELGRVGPGDVLYDLGCGDGRIVIAAAKNFGVRGVGVDLDPRRIEDSLENAAGDGVEDLVSFHVADIFETDFSEASVVAIYLLPSVNLELRPHLLKQLRPGSRVVSHQFHMGEWEPDHHLEVESIYDLADLYLWLIPAPAEGNWNGEIAAGDDRLPISLFLAREFQQVWGAVKLGEVTAPVREGRLRGTGISLETDGFNFEGAGVSLRFLGEVEGDRASGLVLIENGRWTGVYPWQASRR